MKLLSSSFAASAALATLSLLAGCSSSDDPMPSAGGAPAGGSPSVGGSSAGKGGALAVGGGGVSAGGGGAGGSVTVGGGGASAAGAGGLGAGGGSAGTGTAGGAAVEASFATVKGMIGMSCFGGLCHDLNENPLHLYLDDKLYTTLMTHVTKKCGKLVDTANPAESALVKLLKADCNGTARMPYQECWDGDPQDSDNCIHSATVAAIQAWITKGAPQQ